MQKLYIYKKDNNKVGYAEVGRTKRSMEYPLEQPVLLSRSTNQTSLDGEYFSPPGLSGNSYGQEYPLSEPIFVESFFVVGNVSSQVNACAHLRVTANDDVIIYERSFGYGATGYFNDEVTIENDGLLINKLTLLNWSDKSYFVNNYSGIHVKFNYVTTIRVIDQDVPIVYLFDL